MVPNKSGLFMSGSSLFLFLTLVSLSLVLSTTPAVPIGVISKSKVGLEVVVCNRLFTKLRTSDNADGFVGVGFGFLVGTLYNSLIGFLESKGLLYKFCNSLFDSSSWKH